MMRSLLAHAEVEGVVPHTLLLSILLLIGILDVRPWSGAPQPQIVPSKHSKSDALLLSDTVQDSIVVSTYIPIVTRAEELHSSNNHATYYVSKAGNNGNGQSWETAWNELDQIDWEVILPGDTILLDGGTDQMVYTSRLTPRKSGTPDAPITLKLASETGRNGQVVIFGGRSIPLPHCDQPTYTFQTEGVRDMGILLRHVSWIVIDGQKWRGIAIYGHNRYGIELYASVSDITVRNVEVFDNGTAIQENGQWRSDLPGVNLGGTNIRFERSLIHDNGQDAFQWNDTINDFILRYSWLYNSRRHVSVNGPFNYCTHSDGVQIYNGGQQAGFHIRKTIIGPGFSNGVLMGQSLQPSGIQATTDDVTLRNVLFVNATDNSIAGYEETKPRGWIIDHVTSDCLNTLYQCLYLEGTGHQVTDSIFVGASITLPDGVDLSNGNCQWKTSGYVLGEDTDPLFTYINESDPLSLDDYMLRTGSPCAAKGSSLTSVAQLLGTPDPDRVITDLTWEAEEGVVAPPFMVSGNYIVQLNEMDDLILSGRAAYKFNITTSGNYLVKVVVNAPDNAAHLAFFNIDGEPSAQDMQWHIPATKGFEERTVSWSESDGASDPAIFSLSAGEHELVIRGGSAGTRFDRIIVEQIP